MAAMTVVVGADVYENGWVFVRLENGEYAGANVYPNFAAGIEASGDADVIAVDIPIGYPALPADTRVADGLARGMVNPLTSTVFPALHPGVLCKPDRSSASARSRELIGKGVGSTAFGLRDKMLEVAPVAARDQRVYEVHPEVSFRELANRSQEMANRPLVAKRYWNGHMQRRALLAEAGIEIPDHLENAEDAGVADVLDAAAAAWSANRITAGVAVSLPDPPQPDINDQENGRQVAIWY